jgi:hypothetical protein
MDMLPPDSARGEKSEALSGQPIGKLNKPSAGGIYIVRRNEEYATTERQSVVCRKDIWLGLGLTPSLARLGRDDRIHRGIDRRGAAREESDSAFRGLHRGDRHGAVCDLLLEGRSSPMAPGNRQMRSLPNQAPEPTPLAVMPAANAPVAPACGRGSS